jgi:Na+/H+-translocating membrane pyrophosphatase
MRILEKARSKSRHTVICERCISGDEAMYVVSSDVIHMRVCAACAEEARKLGLTVTTRRNIRERPTATSAVGGGLGFEMKLGKLLGATTACLAVCVIYLRMFRNCEN